MDKQKRERLEAKGWRVGTVTEFLGLTSEQEAAIEIRLALSRALKAQRLEAKLTQQAFAKKLHTSQPRLAKMEAGDQSVTMDLLIKGLLASGMDRKKLGETLLAF